MQYRGADRNLHTHVLLYCILVYSCTCLKELATVQKCDIVIHKSKRRYFCSHVGCVSFFIHFNFSVSVLLFSCDQSANKLWGRVSSTHSCPQNTLVLLIYSGFHESSDKTSVFQDARKMFCWLLNLNFQWSEWNHVWFISCEPSPVTI